VCPVEPPRISPSAPISLEVTSWQENTSSSISFVEFKIQVRNGKLVWTVLRRYSEFDSLRKQVFCLLS
jgi:hypothetical protein